jgi:23S rRNA (guanosine2251-2'-O)-methyltransferase
MNKSTDYIYGVHSVQALLSKSAHQAYVLYVQKGLTNPKVTDIMKLAKDQGISMEVVDKSQLERIADQGSHQGVALRVKPQELPSEADLFNLLATMEAAPFLLLLDEIQDPHNFGACLRTAAAAGVDAVIIPKMRSVGLTAAVRKVASGAAEVLPIFAVTNLVRCMHELQEKGIWLMGAAADASQTIYTADLTGPLGLVMGNEASGLRRLTGEECDVLISIPMSDLVESLNVSVATGVCLFEARRQRGWGI